MIYTINECTRRTSKSGKEFFTCIVTNESGEDMKLSSFNPLEVLGKYEIETEQKGIYINLKSAKLIELPPRELSQAHLRKIAELELKVNTFDAKMKKVLGQQRDILIKMDMFEMFFKAMSDK